MLFPPDRSLYGRFPNNSNCILGSFGTERSQVYGGSAPPPISLITWIGQLEIVLWALAVYSQKFELLTGSSR